MPTPPGGVVAPPIYYPPVIWPTPPVGTPPDGGEEGGREPKIEWKTAWSPATGWIVVGVPSEDVNVPVPAKE